MRRWAETVRQAVDHQGFEKRGWLAADAAAEMEDAAMDWAKPGPQDSLRLYSDRIARVVAARGRPETAPTRLRARAEGYCGALSSVRDERVEDPSRASAVSDRISARSPLAEEPDCFDEIYAELDYEPAAAFESGKPVAGARRSDRLWSASAARRTPLSDVIFLAGLAAVFIIVAFGALAPLFLGGGPDRVGAVGPQEAAQALEKIETDSIVSAAGGSDSALCARRLVETATPLGVLPPPDMAMSRVGPVRMTPCAAPPVEEIATASFAPYLGASTLRALLAARPEKCVLDPSAAPGEQPACAELTRYAPNGPFFTSSSPLDEDAVLEINGAYGLEGDAVCHYTPSLTAIVIGGGSGSEAARAFARRIEAHYRESPDRKICHRLRPVGAKDGHQLYVADVFVDGHPARDRFDPRPFELRAGG